MGDFEEGLRLGQIERANSDLNKLNYERLVAEAESLSSMLRPLLPEIETRWPEFNSICAQLRGLCFNAFRLSRQFDAPSQSLPKPKGSTINVSLDDLGL